MVTVNLNSSAYKVMTSHKTKNLIAVAGGRHLIVLDIDSIGYKVILKYQDDNKDEDIRSVELLSVNEKDFCIIGGKIGVVKILDLYKNEIYGYVTAHYQPITGIKAFGLTFITSSEDSNIKCWSFIDFGSNDLLREHTSEITSIDVNTSGKNIVSSGADSKIVEWEYSNNNTTYHPIFNASNIHRCLLTNIMYYGNLIVCLCRNKKVVFLKPKYKTTQSTKRLSQSEDSYSNMTRSQRFLETNTLLNSSDVPFYNTSAFYSPLISVENINLHNDNLEISEKFQLVKEIGLNHAIITKIIISQHVLYCLSDYRFIFKIDLKHLFQDYKVEEVKLRYEITVVNFCVTKDFILVLYEDSVVESIEIK